MNISSKDYLLVILVFINFFPVVSFAADENDSSIILTAPLIAANVVARYNACVDDLRDGCETTFDYCMMTVQEKISFQLQLCYEKKIKCGISCDEKYQECCSQSGEQECPTVCRTQEKICNDQCDTEGTQCTMDAVSGTYNPPIESECWDDWTECIEYTADLCKRENN